MSIPSLLGLRQRYQDVVRLRTIAEVLIRNGLGFIAEQWGLARLLPFWKQRNMAASDDINTLTIPERVRRTVESLGPTFIKLGQILSTRPDLLPPAYIEELSKLLDTATPIPAAEILSALEQELGAPLQELFEHVEAEPIATASIGQVHRAVLKDGTRVVVKIQRPGIERIVEADLNLLARQARFLEIRLAVAREHCLVDLVAEFARNLREELDYTNEGRNADRLRHNLQSDERVLVPRVYWKFTTRRAITLQELEGYKLTELEPLHAKGCDLAAVAEMVVDTYLKQVFVDGFFHADPHPANLMVCDDKIGYIDLGMMGCLMPGTKDMLADLLVSLLDQDVMQVVQAIVRLGAVDIHSDMDGLRRDIQHLFVRYYGLALSEVRLGDFMGDIMEGMFRNRIHLPSDLAMLARGVVVLEGVALTLAPDYVLVEKLQPFAQRLIQERTSFRHLSERALRALRDYDELVRVLPRRTEEISSQLEQGKLTLGFDLKRLPTILTKLDMIVNRLSFSILVAAMIIGSALIIMGGQAVSVWRIPILGWALPVAQLGFVIAGTLAIWLLISIVRSRGL